jgi:hypothetical protein
MASASNNAKSHFMRTTILYPTHHTWRGALREPAVGGGLTFAALQSLPPVQGPELVEAVPPSNYGK